MHIKEKIQTAVQAAVVTALIFVGVHFYKNSLSVDVDQITSGMDPAKYPSGNYGLSKIENGIAGLSAGDIVAYRLPNDSTKTNIARVIAKSGQTIAVSKENPKDKKQPQGVLVDGKPATGIAGTAIFPVSFPETLVPANCLFVMCDTPGVAPDSFNVGPVPLDCVIGKLKP